MNENEEQAFDQSSSPIPDLGGGASSDDFIKNQATQKSINDAKEANRIASAEDAEKNKLKNSPSPQPDKKPNKLSSLKNSIASNKKKPERDRPTSGGNPHVAALDDGVNKFRAALDAFKDLAANDDLKNQLKQIFEELLEDTLGKGSSYSGLDARRDMLDKKSAADNASAAATTAGSTFDESNYNDEEGIELMPFRNMRDTLLHDTELSPSSETSKLSLNPVVHSDHTQDNSKENLVAHSDFTQYDSDDNKSDVKKSL